MEILQHQRARSANTGCPTPPLCDNRNTCLGACKFNRLAPVFAQAEADDQADAAFGIDLQRTRLHALAVTDGYVLDEEDYL